MKIKKLWKHNTIGSKYVVGGRKVNLVDEDWDILVILDACRYDIFRGVYKDVFENDDKITLKKAISPATWTMEWLNKIFGENFYEDIIYISANPFINSKEKVCFKPRYGKMECFDAKKHFFKIVDVWDFGWNDDLGTVHPSQVNKAFVKFYLKYPKKRFILHYMQPHQPYITIGGDNYGIPKIGKSDRDLTSSSIYKKFSRVKLKEVAQKYLSQVQIWKIKELFGLPPTSNIERIYRMHGKKGMIAVYKQEIILALRYIKMLVDSISANWLITSDHGERIGNFWKDSHSGPRDKEVIEVPWLIIKNRDIDVITSGYK